MRNSIKFTFVIAVSILSILFSKVYAQNQEQSDYYYQGYTFEQTDGVKSASPYLTVVMIGGDSNIPKAVQMSNAIGEISFEGTPMNIYVQNKLEVYAGNKLIGVYLPKKWTEKPPFPKGNMSAHMEVSSDLGFYTIKDLMLPTKHSLSLRNFLNTVPDIEMEEDIFFIKGRNGSLRIFVNNNNIPAEKLKSLLDNLTVNYIKSCQLIVFSEANKYFSGAINITLVAGDAGSFPTDSDYIISLPLNH